MKFLPKALFISHGGGPLPLLGHPGHNEMVTCLRQIAADLPRPAAIVVVSAHWEESVPTITAAANPPLIYDYYGFPSESYEIQYPCPGDPELANDIYRMLSVQGIEARLDASRGFDHGVFVPLKIMYPEADIPCVQLSLVRNLDPLLHIEIGAALQTLVDRNVLVIGSGFSFHSIDEFFLPILLSLPRKIRRLSSGCRMFVLILGYPNSNERRCCFIGVKRRAHVFVIRAKSISYLYLCVMDSLNRHLGRCGR